MPTPLEILLDPITIAVILTYFSLVLWEALRPARSLPQVKSWYFKGILSFFAFIFLSTYLPLWYGAWLPSFQLIDLSGAPVALGAVVGVLVYEFALYGWHKAMHRSDRLWKIFHQMHHSAERHDTYGAFYFSPMDMIGFTVMGTICFSIVVGLPAQSITVTLLVTNFLSAFQHANVKTPVWLGYIIERPESHAMHHARGVHAYNYSDLPVYDIIFGTFNNPKDFVNETGFYDGASARMLDMLTFKDVSNQVPGSLGTQVDRNPGNQSPSKPVTQ
jgi:sterol desaturase/sphingolipid hydroxylase (fatty acid hydroxylase superfamily)